MKILPDSIPRLRLAVALIVRNEADTLADTLASVRPLADQIVVLDTGSTDATMAVARQCGAVVGQYPWNDDFAAARNECLKAVSGDWVLWLDAGERLDADSAAPLRAFVDRQADRQHVYTLMIELPPATPTSATEQLAQPRLMPSGMKLQFGGQVRERLQPALEATGLSLQPAPGRILRHRREHDPARKFCKAQRDLRLATLEAGQLGHWPVRLLLAAGEALSSLSEPQNAREKFRQAIALAPAESTELLEAYYGLLTAVDGDQQSKHEALTTCLEALRRFPFDAQLLLALGKYLQTHRHPELALRAFQAAANFGRVEPQIWHLKQWKEVAAVCVTRILQAQAAAGNGHDEQPGVPDDRKFRIDGGSALEQPAPHRDGGSPGAAVRGIGITDEGPARRP